NLADHLAVGRSFLFDHTLLGNGIVVGESANYIFTTDH
ncbi:MAG: hypothetical protein RL040_214, partial [Bacteroidota bacterium]